MTWLFAGLGGFVGACLRYFVGVGMQRAGVQGASFVGTLTVNTVGCLAMGYFATSFAMREEVSPELRSLVLVGLLGGFTTYSAFGYEKLSLLREGQLGAALLHVGAHLVLGLGAVWLGSQLAHHLAR